MKNKINKRTQVSHCKGEVWKVNVGFFQPALLLKGDIPSEAFYVRFKVVLN